MMFLFDLDLSVLWDLLLVLRSVLLVKAMALFKSVN